MVSLEIETGRLILRRPARRDFDRFWAMLNDPVAKEFTGGVTKMGYQERLALFLEECAEEFSPRGAEFAVAEKASGEYLGYCGFRALEELGGNEFLFGYCRDSWGKGYATEAAGAALRFLFSAYPHDAYIATVLPGNMASRRVLQKAGFVPAGSTEGPAGETLEKYLLTRDVFHQVNG